MLTVSISINGEPIYARTVVNRLKDKGVYVCDDGSEIEHDPKEGAVELAVKALKTIVEVDFMKTEDEIRQGGFDQGYVEGQISQRKKDASLLLAK